MLFISLKTLPVLEIFHFFKTFPFLFVSFSLKGSFETGIIMISWTDLHKLANKILEQLKTTFEVRITLNFGARKQQVYQKQTPSKVTFQNFL